MEMGGVIFWVSYYDTQKNYTKKQKVGKVDVKIFLSIFFCFICLISYGNIKKIHCKKILHKYNLTEIIFVGASFVFRVLFHLDVNKIQSNREIGRPVLYVSDQRLKWKD